MVGGGGGICSSVSGCSKNFKQLPSNFAWGKAKAYRILIQIKRNSIVGVKYQRSEVHQYYTFTMDHKKGGCHSKHSVGGGGPILPD